MGLGSDEGVWAWVRIVKRVIRQRSRIALTPQPPPDEFASPEYNLAASALDFSDLTPLSPLSVNGEGGTPASRAHGSPSPFTERGLGGEVEKAGKNTTPAPEVEAKLCTLIS